MIRKNNKTQAKIVSMAVLLTFSLASSVSAFAQENAQAVDSLRPVGYVAKDYLHPKTYTLTETAKGCFQATYFWGTLVGIAIPATLFTLIGDTVGSIGTDKPALGSNANGGSINQGYTSEMWEEVNDKTGEFNEKNCTERWTHLAIVSDQPKSPPKNEVPPAPSAPPAAVPQPPVAAPLVASAESAAAIFTSEPEKLQSLNQ
jgi:hypothetical protein